MRDNRTASMLQRLPRILAVTAAYYGLAEPAGAGAPAGASNAARRPGSSAPGSSACSAQRMNGRSLRHEAAAAAS